jgi:hypothetical protein
MKGKKERGILGFYNSFTIEGPGFNTRLFRCLREEEDAEPTTPVVDTAPGME